jgi:hypothetical protein
MVAPSFYSLHFTFLVSDEVLKAITSLLFIASQRLAEASAHQPMAGDKLN